MPRSVRSFREKRAATNGRDATHSSSNMNRLLLSTQLFPSVLFSQWYLGQMQRGHGDSEQRGKG